MSGIPYDEGRTSALTTKPEDRFSILNTEAQKSGDANEWWRGFFDGIREAGRYHPLVPGSWNQ